MNWINAETKFPEPGIPVIAYGKNELGKSRTIRAYYAPKFTIPDDNEYDAAEYREADDEYYLKEGWYEQNECEEVNWFVYFPITHWMPLPEPPEETTVGNLEKIGANECYRNSSTYVLKPAGPDEPKDIRSGRG